MADAATAGGPLAGIRVIDLTQVVLGPMGTQILGDAGADVIKVEPPDGDMTRFIGPRRSHDMAAYFANLNRNKRGVVLDLKLPAAHAALMILVRTADVFVHNMRLSAAARLGLDYDSLVRINPRIIHACATGFRPGSSQEEDPAYDDIIQGMGGVAHLNGLGAQADGPRYVPSVMVDKLTGTVLASSIAMALFSRERTGRGQAVHVPMMDTLVSFLLPEHMWGHSINAPELGIGYPRMLTPDRRPCVWLVNLGAGRLGDPRQPADYPVQTGVKALYKICVHLGCLYKWAPANDRFECPCHGSKYLTSGSRVDGPARRNLDAFPIEFVDADGKVLASSAPTGAAGVNENAALEVPKGAVALRINTAFRVEGASNTLPGGGL